MPGRDSASPRRAAAAGFTLLELMVVIALLGAIAGMAIVVIRSAGERSARVSSRAEARTELILARRQLLEDIRRSRAVETDGASLRLRGAGSPTVVWDISGGRLRRTAGDRVRVFRLPCRALSVSASRGGAATSQVEVRVVPEDGGSILAASARTRIVEAAP